MHIRFTAPVALVAFGLLLSATAQEPPPSPKSCAEPETCVAVDVRVVSVTSDVAERCGLAMPVAFLNDLQVALFLEAVQGDKHTTVLAAPKLTVLNGQKANIKIGTEHRFGTDMSTVESEDQNTLSRTTGLDLCVQPTISADRRFVQFRVRSELSSLVPCGAWCPVTTLITPILEGGAQGKPVPFTQFVQKPVFNVQAFEQVLAVPDGGTVVLGGVKRTRESVRCDGVPILSKLPYVNRLFKNVAASPEMETVVMLLTPRIVLNEAEEQKVVPPSKAVLVQPPMPRPAPAVKALPHPPQPPAFARAAAPMLYTPPPAVAPVVMPPATRMSAPALMPASCWVSVEKDCATLPANSGSAFRANQVAKLVEMYHEACAGGHAAEARKLAEFALELDPTCFSKRHPTPLPARTK